jgi:hypothetical protein
MARDSRAIAFKSIKSLTPLAAMLVFCGITNVRAEDTNVALELGTVIGSEEACGLTYAQDVIKRFINDHVKATDMSFPSMLNAMTTGTKYQIENMSKSSLTAHCAQVRRIAEKYGFTK